MPLRREGMDGINWCRCHSNVPFAILVADSVLHREVAAGQLVRGMCEGCYNDMCQAYVLDFREGWLSLMPAGQF